MINELNKKQIICNPNYYAVYGLLIGDALGLPLEFSHREIVYRRKFKHLLIDNNIKDETIYRKSRDHEAGTISDDGSLALATIVALRKTFGKNNNIKEQQYLKNAVIELLKTENLIYQELMHNVMKKYYDWLATGKYAETAYQSLDCGETFREALIEYQKKVVIANKNNERNYLFQEKQDDFQHKSGNGTLMKQAAISCYFLNESRYNIDKIKIPFSNNRSDEFNDNWLLDELNHKYQTESQDSSFKELIDITTIVSSDINWITHNSVINDYLVKVFNLFIICLSILDLDINERNDIKLKQKIIIDILKFIDTFEFHKIDNLRFEFKNSEDKANAIKTISEIRHQLFDLVTEKELQIQNLEAKNNVNAENQKEIKTEKQDVYSLLKNKIKSLFTNKQDDSCKLNNDKDEHGVDVAAKKEITSESSNDEKTNEEYSLQRSPVFTFQSNGYKDLLNSAYSFDSLLSALYCFYHSSDFQEAIVNAANLCGDADTIAAITGQLAGAYYQDDIQNKCYYLLNGLKHKDKHEKIINDRQTIAFTFDKPISKEEVRCILDRKQN